MISKRLWTASFVSVLSLTLMADFAQAQTITESTPSIKSDGTMSEVARAAMTGGRLLMNTADAALKKAATDAALLEDASRSAPSELTPQDGGSAKTPAILGGRTFAGQSATQSSPPDSTGAIGPFSYIQAVNMAVTIYNRTTKAVIATGTLNQLANNAENAVKSFDAQINWDATTNRFYYVMDSVFSTTNNKLAWGFSKTNNPANVTTDWCHYLYTPADPARFPYYPKLGDSSQFIIIGANSFKPYSIPGGTFVGADLIAISKPPSGKTCPGAGTFKKATRLSLKDNAGKDVFAPVPANQIDNSPTGYVMARNGTLPSDKLWFFSVTRNATTGLPVFGAPRGLNVPSYTMPPAASQPTFSQMLDTLDARPTQAVQAVNPDRGTFSFWVQHTVKQDALNLAEVRWYEINPVPALPKLLRSGKINNTKSHFYNAAISPDRRKDGTTVAFGDSFVIQFNVSGSASAISPRIMAGSSFNGGALTFALIRNAVGPYRDLTCQKPGDVCRWGDHWGAAPDPKPTALGRGTVWITNQYSGRVNPPSTTANFRTWISAVQP